jgi:hypothetical protein
MSPVLLKEAPRAFPEGPTTTEAYFQAGRKVKAKPLYHFENSAEKEVKTPHCNDQILVFKREIDRGDAVLGSLSPIRLLPRRVMM